MIFRQLFDAESSTYTYLLGDEQTREALLIDPVREQVDRDVKLVGELGLKLAFVLDTHTHADHVTGAGELRARTGARTGGSRKAAPCADLHVGDGERIQIGGIELVVLETPGHTDDSVSYLVGDRVFTGDALLIRGAGRTDFQNGDAAALYRSLTEVLFALPDATLVYPAHDYRGLTVSTIGEEKRFNARVANRTRDEFIAVMRSLNLPAPKKIDIAVPANRACGVETKVLQG
jgi:glyoxylase-like metal-dependent hydrolase (beta-lactamase superfamily II)